MKTNIRDFRRHLLIKRGIKTPQVKQLMKKAFNDITIYKDYPIMYDFIMDFDQAIERTSRLMNIPEKQIIDVIQNLLHDFPKLRQEDTLEGIDESLTWIKAFYLARTFPHFSFSKLFLRVYFLRIFHIIYAKEIDIESNIDKNKKK